MSSADNTAPSAGARSPKRRHIRVRTKAVANHQSTGDVNTTSDDDVAVDISVPSAEKKMKKKKIRHKFETQLVKV